jgi:hypothetical protein
MYLSFGFGDDAFVLRLVYVVCRLLLQRGQVVLHPSNGLFDASL